MQTHHILYMVSAPEENVIYAMGMEFHEFAQALPAPLNHVLLLKSEYYCGDLHRKLLLEYVQQEQVLDLLKQNVHMYGDFCWVDFEHVEALDLLEEQELAELLYLGHLKKPLTSPFFEKLQNRYAYLAHDDGWFCKVYARDETDFVHLIGNLLTQKMKTRRKRAILPLDQELAKSLFDSAQEGLLIDFDQTVFGPRTIEVPFYVIGKTLDFDGVYNDIRRHMGRSSKSWLVYKAKRWGIERW